MGGYGSPKTQQYPSGSRGAMLYDKPRTYRDYVAFLCSRNPCLLNLLGFLSSPKTYGRTSQVTALDFYEGTSSPVIRHLNDVDFLPQELHGGHKQESKLDYNNHRLQGRMLIIEDMTEDVVELLGSNLDIDPLFFALHLHTTQRNDTRSQTPDEATLPSRLTTQDYLNTTYHQPLVCDKLPLDNQKLVRDMTIDRKLIFIRSTSIGLAQHCVSVIKVQRSRDFWISLLLADPSISDSYYPSGKKGNPALNIRLSLKPFLGEHEDFLDPPKFSDDWAHLDESSSRGSMASEVIQYFERSIPPCFNPKDPSIESLAYYPLRIVAAEWVKYVAVMQHCIKRYEYRGDQLPHLDQFNTDLRELQGWRRRSMASQQKVRAIIRRLKARRSCGENDRDCLDHLIEDFEVINDNIRNAGRRLENMLPVVTSLVQIIDARRSFAETTNISRLTILALVFVPLSFVSSLFSMNSINGPGGPKFWVYFAVAIPITLLVFLVARPPTQAVMKCIQWLKSSRKGRRVAPRDSTKAAVEPTEA